MRQQTAERQLMPRKTFGMAEKSVQNCVSGLGTALQTKVEFTPASQTAAEVKFTPMSQRAAAEVESRSILFAKDDIEKPVSGRGNT